MASIGFVGLGTMGSRIAGRMLSLGHEVYGTNRTRSKADPLIEQGLRWRDSPREVAEAADVVFSMVTDDEALEAVTSGPDGILSGLAVGQIYVDMSTVSPQVNREVAGRVTALGGSMLAAPASGDGPAAKDGRLSIIVGGDVEAFERVEPILLQLGSVVTFVGDSGQALLLKLAINVSLAVHMFAFSEGVLLAEQGGIERDLAIDVLMRSATGSPLLQARVPQLLELPDKAWLDVHDLLSAARLLGYVHRDIASLFQVLSEMVTAPAERGLGFGASGASRALLGPG
jgi:3-hydroxyisobutyrate dehydrogenase-like beta-hydroxyacid dehydrogenase